MRGPERPGGWSTPGGKVAPEDCTRTPLFTFRLRAESKVTTPAGLSLRPFPGWCDRSRLHSVIT